MHNDEKINHSEPCFVFTWKHWLLALAWMTSSTLLFWATHTLLLHFNNKPSLDSARKNRLEITSWPAMEATLDEFTIYEEIVGRGHTSHYILYVTYHYFVNGQKYIGRKLSHDFHKYSASDFNDFEKIIKKLVPDYDPTPFLKDPTCSHLSGYDSCEFTYHTLQRINIHVDAEDPTNSVIDNRYDEPITALEYLVSPLVWIATVAASAFGFLLWSFTLVLKRFHHEEGAAMQFCAGLAASFGLVAAGLGLLACCLEYYIANLGWRGAVNDSQFFFATVVGFIFIFLFGVLGISLLFGGIANLFKLRT